MHHNKFRSDVMAEKSIKICARKENTSNKTPQVGHIYCFCGRQASVNANLHSRHTFSAPGFAGTCHIWPRANECACFIILLLYCGGHAAASTPGCWCIEKMAITLWVETCMNNRGSGPLSLALNLCICVRSLSANSCNKLRESWLWSRSISTGTTQLACNLSSTPLCIATSRAVL